jgi:glyoxylase-like metal-dependent hydrolase (beta-lactamase superfamily II)
MIYGYGRREVLDFPLIAYYIEGEHRILVDTGGSHPDSAQGKRAAPYRRRPEQELDAALSAIGVSAKDIDYLILTHLHWDHAGNNHLFTHIPIFCQKLEFDNLIDPAGDRKGYDTDDVLQYSYELVDGDKQLFDGVSVLLAPGHTKGMQCVVVDTEKGKAVITGDLAPLREGLEYDPPRCNALLYSDEAYEQARSSLDKVLSVSRMILPGHDSGVFLDTTEH